MLEHKIIIGANENRVEKINWKSKNIPDEF
jgi:hypothetical protein